MLANRARRQQIPPPSPPPPESFSAAAAIAAASAHSANRAPLPVIRWEGRLERAASRKRSGGGRNAGDPARLLGRGGCLPAPAPPRLNRDAELTAEGGGSQYALMKAEVLVAPSCSVDVNCAD